MEKNIFYDFNKLFSYDKLFNFILGERGVGKTYGILKYAMNRFIKKGEQFAYVRRYKTELKEAASIFTPLIINNEFGEHEITFKGMKWYCDGQEAGHAIVLSTAMTKKSMTYPDVSTIIYDEFIIAKGAIHYLNREAEAFLELYETIARMRDVKCFFIGNAISIANPYFEYFNLTIPYDGQFKVYKNDMIVNYIKNEAYREAKRETRFGKLISGTNYSAYAIDNNFLVDSNEFIERKTGNCTIWLNMLVGNKTYGVWKKMCEDGDLLYVSDSYDPNCQYVYALNNEAHNALSELQTSSGVVIRQLFYLYRKGRVRFESLQIKSATLPYLLRGY